MSTKPLLLDLFQAGVNAVVGDAAVERSLKETPLASDAPVHLLAIGKAANAMVKGAVAGLAQAPVRGLQITKYGHTTDDVARLPWLSVMESSHPVPDEASIKAGAAMIEFVKTVPNDAQLVVLMSGGASALVEQLIDGLSLADMKQLTDQLLSGGLPIDDMNRVRKTVSAVKGGKLAAQLGQYPVTQFVISDVPGDRLPDIGSGLLAAPDAVDSGHPADALNDLPIALPDTVVACINAFGVTAPDATDAVWKNITTHFVGSSDIAQAAIVNAYQQQEASPQVIQANGSLHGDVEVIADRIAQALLEDKRPGLRVWGGETHLVLPAAPGRGGRNQHLALAVAQRIAGEPGLSILCCGTDGSDGPTGDAGGCISGETVAAGEALSLHAADYLSRADAGNFLAATDTLVTTGPTGTNVMDVAIAIRL